MLALLLATVALGADDLLIDTGLAFRRSSWRGDWLGGPRLGAGYRLNGIIGPDALAWTELGSVDTRVNTGLTVGVNLALLPERATRPTLRLYGVHQHEEGIVSVLESPWTTALGIGPGIRHRAGAGFRLGVERELSSSPGPRRWVGLLDLDTTWIPDTLLGPRWMVGLSAGVGHRIRLERP